MISEIASEDGRKCCHCDFDILKGQKYIKIDIKLPVGREVFVSQNEANYKDNWIEGYSNYHQECWAMITLAAMQGIGKFGVSEDEASGVMKEFVKGLFKI